MQTRDTMAHRRVWNSMIRRKKHESLTPDAGSHCEYCVVSAVFPPDGSRALLIERRFLLFCSPHYEEIDVAKKPRLVHQTDPRPELAERQVRRGRGGGF